EIPFGGLQVAVELAPPGALDERVAVRDTCEEWSTAVRLRVTRTPCDRDVNDTQPNASRRREHPRRILDGPLLLHLGGGALRRKRALRVDQVVLEVHDQERRSGGFDIGHG